ncbi:MAG: hypothetical protein BroJett003_09180 [Planctomycetota bacterium]|nr:MAG: hypothetical protein BroJett003_09180 [Planctomycetota bacterium]
MLNFVNIRNQFVTASFLGTGMAAMSALTRPCLAAAALPMLVNATANVTCGNPVSCLCTETIPCDCHESGSCAATVVATADHFDYDDSACYILATMSSICAIGQNCTPPGASSCANDDGCYAYGNPLFIYATKYFAQPQTCECDPVG